RRAKVQHRIVLEYNATVAVRRANRSTIDQRNALSKWTKANDAVQQPTADAARRPDDAENLAGKHIDVDPAEHALALAGVRILENDPDPAKADGRFLRGRLRGTRRCSIHAKAQRFRQRLKWKIARSMMNARRQITAM